MYLTNQNAFHKIQHVPKIFYNLYLKSQDFLTGFMHGKHFLFINKIGNFNIDQNTIDIFNYHNCFFYKIFKDTNNKETRFLNKYKFLH